MRFHHGVPAVSFRACALFLLPALAGFQPCSAQERPHIIIRSPDPNTLVAALRRECEAAGFRFVKSDKHGALFSFDAGNMRVSMGEVAPVRLETTFHFEKDQAGTRVVVTEQLVATMRDHSEWRRKPESTERFQAYKEILEHAKARVETLPSPGDSAAGHAAAPPG